MRASGPANGRRGVAPPLDLSAGGGSARTGPVPPFEAGGTKSSGGVALITVIILLLFLGALGTALLATVYARLSAITLEVDRLQAQYLAEAGIAQGLHEIKTGLDVFGGGRGAIPVTALGAGFYKVDIDPKTSTLTAIGVVRDVRRVIVNKYE